MKGAKNVKATGGSKSRPDAAGKNNGAKANVRVPVRPDHAGKRGSSPAKEGRVGVGAQPATGTHRTSRGSTEPEWRAGDFRTGQLGVELAKTNDHIKRILIAGGHLKPDGTTLDRLKPGPGYDPVDRRTVGDQIAFSPRLAAIGRSIAGVDARPPIVMPEPGYVSPMYRAPQPMSQETKERIRAVSKPKDNGDEIAGLLRDCKDLDDVYRVGAKYLKLKEKELRDKYGHLNPGQQRMNVGNRMRGAFRKQQEGKK